MPTLPTGYVQSVRVEYTREYLNWIVSLPNAAIQWRVQQRVERLIGGNPGSHRHLGKGVIELKIDTGPGYRIYCSRVGRDTLILLVGGDKRSQVRDIQKALELRSLYREG